MREYHRSFPPFLGEQIRLRICLCAIIVFLIFSSAISASALAHQASASQLELSYSAAGIPIRCFLSGSVLSCLSGHLPRGTRRARVESVRSSLEPVAARSARFTVVKSRRECMAGCPETKGGVWIFSIDVKNNGVDTYRSVVEDSLSPGNAMNLGFGGKEIPLSLLLAGTGLRAGTPQFSRDNGRSWSYTPVSGGGGAPSGFDSNITNFRIPVSGAFSAGKRYVVSYETTTWR